MRNGDDPGQAMNMEDCARDNGQNILEERSILGRISLSVEVHHSVQLMELFFPGEELKKSGK